MWLCRVTLLISTHASSPVEQESGREVPESGGKCNYMCVYIYIYIYISYMFVYVMFYYISIMLYCVISCYIIGCYSIVNSPSPFIRLGSWSKTQSQHIVIDVANTLAPYIITVANNTNWPTITHRSKPNKQTHQNTTYVRCDVISVLFIFVVLFCSTTNVCYLWRYYIRIWEPGSRSAGRHGWGARPRAPNI